MAPSHFSFITPTDFLEIAKPNTIDMDRYARRIHKAINTYLNCIEAYLRIEGWEEYLDWDELQLPVRPYTSAEYQEAKVIVTMLKGLKAQLHYDARVGYNWKKTMETFDVLHKICPNFEHPLARPGSERMKINHCHNHTIYNYDEEGENNPPCQALIHFHDDWEMHCVAEEHEKLIRSLD